MRKPESIIYIFICVFILVYIAGCESHLHKEINNQIGENPVIESGNSMDYGRDAFSKEELHELFECYRYEFNYVVTYLEHIGDTIITVAITDDLQQVSFASGDNLNLDYMSNYVDLGYEKDDEFERCLKTILVDSQLGYLYYYRAAGVSFGKNAPVLYLYGYADLQIAKTAISTNNPDAIGQIEGNWFYYAHDPEFRMGDSYVDYGQTGLKREEIIELYYQYQYEFNLIITYLRKLGVETTYVVLTDNYEQVSFSLSGNRERMRGYVELGFERNEEFERCLRTVLVDGEFGFIYYTNWSTSHFGPNYPLMYSESDLFETSFGKIRDLFFGRIEGNWYYYVGL